jgi:hypothetical protein
MEQQYCSRNETPPFEPCMDVARAIFRLLIVAAFGWLAFWGWRYASGCIHARGAIFFCPDASGQSLVRTSGLRIALHLLLLPLSSLAVSCWIWRSQRLAGRKSEFD